MIPLPTYEIECRDGVFVIIATVTLKSLIFRARSEYEANTEIAELMASDRRTMDAMKDIK